MNIRFLFSLLSHRFPYPPGSYIHYIFTFCGRRHIIRAPLAKRAAIRAPSILTFCYIYTVICYIYTDICYQNVIY